MAVNKYLDFLNLSSYNDNDDDFILARDALDIDMEENK